MTRINGRKHRKAYVNSAAGRSSFTGECAACENFAQVMAAWGESALAEPCASVGEQPSVPERINAAEEAILGLMMGGI